MVIRPFGPLVQFGAGIKYFFDDVISFLEERGCPDEVCFDHDLGETGENERNGRTCAKAIIDYCIAHDIDAPAYNIQSSNPVGRDSIKSIMDGWHRFYAGIHSR